MTVLRGVIFLVAIGAAGCATRAQPFRFSSPLLGQADVPPAWSAAPADPNARYRRPEADTTITVQRGIHLTPVEDPRPGTIRVASAQAASDVAAVAEANGVVLSRLPANHRFDDNEPHATLHEPSDLRALVGRRDVRDSVTAALAWSAELGATIDLDLVRPDAPAKASYRVRAAATIAASITNTGKLVAWSTTHDRSADDAVPGSLLVFSRTESDDSPDLVALTIGRDERGVTEFIFSAGGAIRRGFYDTRHADKRRDAAGRVLNTFLRTGNRWPQKGTHYLAGELLVHVIRTR
jgi:hypothetical protein